jgi:hypothetical protein
VRVAIINPKLNVPQYGECLETLGIMIGHNGHEVDLVTQIMCLPRPLDDYDLAISHPLKEDGAFLGEEIMRRPEFRWIIHSTNPEDYAQKEIRESSQVYSRGYIKLGEMIRLVNKGW